MVIRTNGWIPRKRGWAGMIFSTLFPVFSLLGQGNAQKPGLDAGSNLMLRSSDMHFVLGLSQAAIGEAEVGRLAANKAQSSDVKAFGRLMTDEYTKMDDALKRLAFSYRATLPDEIPATQLALRTKLQGKTGRRFDRTYMKAMVKNLKGRVKSFRKEIKKGRDPAIQKFASETLPVVEGHLEKARALYLATKTKAPGTLGTEKTL